MASPNHSLAQADDALDNRLLLLNGNSFFDINYLDLAAPLGDGMLARVALRRVEGAARYGLVHLVGERSRAFIDIGIPQDLARTDGLTAGRHWRPAASLTPTGC